MRKALNPLEKLISAYGYVFYSLGRIREQEKRRIFILEEALSSYKKAKFLVERMLNMENNF